MDKKKTKSAVPAKQTPMDYYTMAEFASKMRCSAITLRRRIADGRCKGLVLMDPFKTGRPLITKASADTFIAERLKATAKEYTPAPFLQAQANG